MRNFWMLAMILVTSSLGSEMALAHCQVPCGIYDDDGRFTAMAEDVTTIEKAVGEIDKLAKNSDALSANQLARWVATKEDHASKIIETVSTYFLTQKIKPVGVKEEGRDAFLNRLETAHSLMRAAMAAKQQVSPEAVQSLRNALEAFKMAMK